MKHCLSSLKSTLNLVEQKTIDYTSPNLFHYSFAVLKTTRLFNSMIVTIYSTMQILASCWALDHCGFHAFREGIAIAVLNKG